jgi:hypothetical protein
MAASQTCAQKTLLRIGTARGNMAFLRQPEASQLSTILNRYALQYRISPNAMTKAKALSGATPEDCAWTLASSLDKITADAGFIKGINHTDAEIVNSHLGVLVSEVASFSLAQELSEKSRANIETAVARFIAKEFDGEYAGSARPVVNFMTTLRA